MRKSNTDTVDLAVDLAEALRSAVSTFVRQIRYDTDTPRSAQYDTLELLERDGPANIATLAHIRKVKHQSMRLVTAQLEEAGLVERAEDAHDRRSAVFSVSARGRDWLHALRAKRTVRIAEMIAQRLTPAEQAELRAATRLLNRLAEDEPGSG